MPFTRTCGREGRGEGGAQTRAPRIEKAQAERPPTRWMSTSRRGQDVRGVAPSTVAANIQGVFSLVLPGVDISQRRAVGTYVTR